MKNNIDIGTIIDDMTILKILNKEDKCELNIKDNHITYHVKCNICGTEKYMASHNLNKHIGTSHMSCSRYIKINIGEIYKDYTCIKKLENQYYTMKCNICGHEKNIRKDQILRGDGITHSYLNCHTLDIENFDLKIGQIIGDRRIIGITYGNIDGQNSSVRSYIKTECIKCKKIKYMRVEDIKNRKVGIYHDSCISRSEYRDISDTFQARHVHMKERCNTIRLNHNSYYFKGIRVEDEFELFVDFYNLMYRSFIELANVIGDKNVSIERINNDLNYSYNNCIWIHKHDQYINQKNPIYEIYLILNDNTKVKIYNLAEFYIENKLTDPVIWNNNECVINGYKFKKEITGKKNIVYRYPEYTCFMKSQYDTTIPIGSIEDEVVLITPEYIKEGNKIIYNY